jgi:charged multivesicular body protein 5
MEAGGSVPGFLQDEVVPDFVDEPPQTEDKVKQAAG